MRWNIIGAFIRNNPFGTEIAFRKGLERIGETVTVIDPSFPDQRFDEEPDVTLVFKWLDPGALRSKVKSLPGKKVIYQVDDLRFPHIQRMMEEMREVCDHALTFDESGANLAMHHGYDTSMPLLLTADNLLYRRLGYPKVVDVCFVGSLTGGPNHASRARMVEVVRKLGLKFVVASEVFDIERLCNVYNMSKVVLNHATDVGQGFGHGFGYQCRHFEAGFTGAALLSNRVDSEVRLQNFETFGSEDELVEKLQGLLQDDVRRQGLGNAFYDELYAAHLPEHRARQLVEFVKEFSS